MDSPRLISVCTYTEDDKQSRDYCQGLANKLASMSDLPKSCRKYPDIVKTLERRTTGKKEDAALAFEGMSPGEAAQARAARSKGQQHHAQIQRRYTQTRRFTKQAK